MSQEASAFQVAWHSTLQKIPAARGGLRASDPYILSEKTETQTQGTPVFLYEEIQSGHITGKKDLQKLGSSFFSTYKPLNWND